ncbi:hypothetical protein ACFOQM_23650 [Paenibacillus sp. GCM10012307]|uniref:Uncharacterized protein n=1 Tax=Paenibacillus roseus TaxID=2798579 RepID=A0A934J9B6_9BACL|nr:hypothetical protein [Paenibacillus roseus]MBJ6364219.1 hypothetical protein [Paenibacillus roseus]
MKSIPITKSYALSADDHNFVLQRKHTVDPTKAPGYKPDPAKSPPISREEWRDIGWYPLTRSGLISAVEIALLREVNGSTEATTLAALLSEYTAETVRLREIIVNTVGPLFPEVQ